MAKKQKENSHGRNISPQAKPPGNAVGISKNDWFTQIDAWLSARHWVVVTGLIVLSVAVRSFFFQQVKDSPAKSLHTWAQSDMAFYDYWARHILSGDILCDTALQPYHSWHDSFAAGYLGLYSEAATAYYTKHTDVSGRIDTLAARHALIADVHQGKVYYQEPLYTYLVAFTYKIFGTTPIWVYLWQMLLGIGSVVLIYLISRRYFGASAGTLAALLVLLSGPVLVYEFTLLRTTLTTFLSLLLIHTYQRLLDRSDRKSQLVFGATGAIAMLAQSYLALFFIPALGWYAWLLRGNKKAFATGLAFVLVAYVVVMSPLYIRNIMVNVPLTSIRSNGAITYAMFNSAKSRPLEPNFTEMDNTVRIMHDADGRFGKAVFACLKTFANTRELLNLYKQKVNGLFMWYEIPNNMSYYMYREFSPLLSGLPAPYRLLAPLGIGGLLIGAWRFRWKFVPFLLMTLVSASPLFISTSLSRYRIPFVIFMSILAAYFIIQLLQEGLRANWKIVLVSITLAIVFWLYTDNIRSRQFYPLYASDLTSIYICHYQNRLTALEKEKNFDEYVRLTTELVGYIPKHFHKLRADDGLFSSNEADCCQVAASIFTMHGNALNFTGRNKEGTVFLERARILNQVAERFRQMYMR